MRFHILKSCKWSGDRRFAQEWPATGKRSEAEILRAVPLDYLRFSCARDEERAGGQGRCPVPLYGDCVCAFHLYLLNAGLAEQTRRSKDEDKNQERKGKNIFIITGNITGGK